ncbi:MAG TPA: GNAT family N-acetyltransferase [Rhizomicrobium sp.]|nr:GNAT family N-acetyltransferase [Rhizomicrobium sp.]
MTAIDQHAVNGLARELDPIAVESWPGRETENLDGWLLRFTDGYSSRANSVSALNFHGVSLERSIAAAESAYRARDLVPQFQITPATQPTELEAVLVRRGYTHRTPTLLMVADAAGIEEQTDVRMSSSVDETFAALTREGSHSPADGDERLSILARIGHPKALVTAEESGNAVACGASVAIGDWASVYVMRTTPSARRRGHGQRVLRGIAQWALSHGASRLYLQVDESNMGAVALYARAGFRVGYRYLHYFAPIRTGLAPK